MATEGTITTAAVLPPLDAFTHAELRDLVAILHGALLRAQADYTKLSEAVRIATERAA
jgi:hypothetical protein